MKTGPKGNTKRDARISREAQARLNKLRLKRKNAENQLTVLLPKRIADLDARIAKLSA